jgi:hypothetical protein
MSTSSRPPDIERDSKLARDLCEAARVLQQCIHLAVEAGLKVTVEVEKMNHIGHHYEEPLLNVTAERVIRLT